MRIVAALLLLTTSLFADNLKDLPQKAIAKSDITAVGAKPFHLKAHTFEATNKDNDLYQAEIEEWWAAPDRYKRVIHAKNFSETLIVSGGETSDDITGD